MGNIRRSRGYSYEYSIVNRLNNRNWIAKRLGGSSVGLPDIIAVNNNKAILLVIEAKSGTGESLYVPSDQIERCFSIVKMFRYYNYKYVILAFKFLRKKRIKIKNEFEICSACDGQYPTKNHVKKILIKIPPTLTKAYFRGRSSSRNFAKGIIPKASKAITKILT